MAQKTFKDISKYATGIVLLHKDKIFHMHALFKTIIFILKLYNVFPLLILCFKIFPGHFISVKHVKAHRVLQQQDIPSYLGSRAESHGTLTKLLVSDDCHFPPIQITFNEMPEVIRKCCMNYITTLNCITKGT